MNHHSAIDTLRINLLNNIADKVINIDPEKSLRFAIESDSLTGILNHKKGKATALFLKGKSSFLLSDFVTASECLQKAIQLFEKSRNKKGLANCYILNGNIYSIMGDYEKSMEFFQKSLKISEEIN